MQVWERVDHLAVELENHFALLLDLRLQLADAILLGRLFLARLLLLLPLGVHSPLLVLPAQDIERALRLRRCRESVTGPAGSGFASIGVHLPEASMRYRDFNDETDQQAKEARSGSEAALTL